MAFKRLNDMFSLREQTSPNLKFSPLKEGAMVRYHSEDLLRQHGFEEGLKLMNVLTARDLGMIPERRAVHFVRQNVMFFSGHGNPEQGHQH